jgi:hypothetical protein
MAEDGIVRFRLIRADDRPATNPEGDAYAFGLQDTKEALHRGVTLPDGRLAFDFELRVRPGKDGRPNFLGDFASGPAGDRFVYLAWRSLPRGVWINRVKAPLGPIEWPLIEAAQAEGRRIVADVTGRGPGGGRAAIAWRLG